MTTSFRSRYTRALSYALCTFLLFAQQAALTHVVWHAAAEHASPQGTAHAYEREREPAPKLAGLCAYDAAFGQVLGAGFSAGDPVVARAARSQVALHCSRAWTAADALTPRSRGPPVIL